MGVEELSQLNEAINHCDEVILKLKNTKTFLFYLLR